MATPGKKTQNETENNLIQQLLTKGASEVIVKKDLEEKLKSGKKLRIKFGIDPSGHDLHLGHMVVIKKLKEFQDLGHQIVLLYGNFTAQIGDPTGKNETRKVKTQQEVENNARNYQDQVKKILDMSKVEIVWNADWLGKLNFSDVMTLASHFTVAQMLERDMFQQRIKSNQPISVHEFLYPLMQGYDSVAIKADVELGGTEQTFNLLAGRVLQKAYGQAPQNILTVPLLVGLDGTKKMGKSEDNFIAVNDTPKDMFGKVMSLPDHLIIHYYELCTLRTTEEINEITEKLKNGTNPRDLKMALALDITEQYHDQIKAEQAKQEFIEIFSKGGLPDNIECIKVKHAEQNILELLFENKLVSSKSEARRLIEGGGVKVDQEKVISAEQNISLQQERLVQIGKRKFIKFIHS
jgi:tyrosyl-tRNA synthetase